MQRLEALRLHVARPDALIQLAVLGLLAGLLSGAVIVGFRLLVEGSQEAILPGQGAENYEALPGWARLLLPLLGGVLLALLFRWGADGLYRLGVPRVMERMAYFQGYLTARGFVLQFVGAAIAIVSGHSVGREGPHIYLGAAASSLLGQRLSLPNNSIRTLVGCGTAAGIAASFNTPLAGVVFALEVVMMEYTVASFIPVIVAATSATALSVAVFGPEPAFSMPPLAPFNLGEIPAVLLLGLVAGGLSALYVHLLQRIAERSAAVPIWWRMLLAGMVVGVCALAVPQVMGIGYDSVNLALLGQLGAGTLLLMVTFKLLATSACVGLGVPGGTIGPALFMGAGLGSLAGMLAAELYPGMQSPVSLYALLGMGAMMGASLQAPLAALTAMVELTHSPGIVMPGMLAVVVAGLTASELFRKESLFHAMLKASGMDYAANPVMQTLRRVGVAAVMAKNFVRVDPQISFHLAQAIVQGETDWILLDEEGQPARLMRTVDLARYLHGYPEESAQVDLLAIPADRLQVAPVPLQASLQEAHTLLEQDSVEALYVHGHSRGREEQIYGVLTPQLVESAYRF
jgi:H+/Cl- antiporter ClcA